LNQQRLIALDGHEREARSPLHEHRPLQLARGHLDTIQIKSEGSPETRELESTFEAPARDQLWL
jgi:hypothetical protein